MLKLNVDKEALRVIFRPTKLNLLDRIGQWCWVNYSGVG